MEKYAVIVAGGTGSRMGASTPKQFLQLRGKPLLWHTVTAFLTAFSDLQIILVVPEQHIETARSIALSTYDPSRISIAIGGQTRFHSVKNGLDHIYRQSVVFVHDGVRCLVTTALIRNCYASTLDKGNAVPAIPPADTIRIETANGNELVDRNTIRLIQTPQTFLLEIIKTAFEQEYNEIFTDEATVVEKMGIKINLIEGESMNIKVTRPVDLLVAEKVLAEREIH